MAFKKQVKKSKSKTNHSSWIKAFVMVFIISILGFTTVFLTNKKFDIPQNINNKFIKQKNVNKIAKPEKIDKTEKTESIEIYFVKGKKNQGITYLEYIPVKRAVKKGENHFETAIKELLKGSSLQEKQQGINTEIPTATKLLGISSDPKSYTINLSEDFQFGGGTDSMKARVYQVIKTATSASEGKDVYLQLDGEKIEVIGGEGIIIKQPINKNL
ncbi:MAG: GerMN domain-containing protein [Candidatus Gastranaerophilaceae bacterium]|jgi:spore germination protein GerM